MLCLARKVGESVSVGLTVVVTVLRIGGNSVRIGIEAPDGVVILRNELFSEASFDKTVDLRSLAEIEKYDPIAMGC